MRGVFWGLSVFLKAMRFGAGWLKERLCRPTSWPRRRPLAHHYSHDDTALFTFCFRVILFLNMGSVIGVLVLGGTLSTGQMNHRQLLMVSTQAIFHELNARRNFSDA